MGRLKLDGFTALRYRGIDGLALPSLSKANLITGANGVGKTALLEAMWLFTGRHNPALLWNPNIQRGVGPALNPISRLGNEFLELSGRENGEQHKVKFSFEEMEGASSNIKIAGNLQEYAKNFPPISGIIRTFIDGKHVKNGTDGLHVTPAGAVLHHSWNAPAGRPDCIIESTRFQHDTTAEYLQRYSSLVREGRKEELMQALHLVANGIEGAEILTDDNGEAYLSIGIRGKTPRPLYDLGGGAVRLVRLLLGFSAARNGILFSDELENGIHHSIQRDLWRNARRWMAQWNVQLVATTHSGEFIDAAIDAFADDMEGLAIHKLYFNEKTNVTEVAIFTGDSLRGARELSLEIR